MTVSLLRLPPLDLLRSFVAVGRRLSITIAAHELCLSQSAVSRQIQALEEFVGTKLLVRGHRSLAFTPEGAKIFEAADASLINLQEVFSETDIIRRRRPVTLTAPTGFAALWLIPRTKRLQLIHPCIELRISSNNRIVDLRSEGIDLAVRYGPQRYVPEGAIHLFNETIAPVASADMFPAPLTIPDQISGQFLLEFDGATRRSHLSWPTWLRQRGWEDARPKGIQRFNQYEQVIQAALAGQGIALGRIELIDQLLADEALVLLEDPSPAYETGSSHWLLCADAKPRPDVLDVTAWIHTEVMQGHH